MHYWIKGPQVMTEGGIEPLCLEIAEGKIVQMLKAIPEDILKNKNKNNFIKEYPEDFYLIPGFIDLHIHGSLGSDVMDGTPEALKIISSSLAKQGTTAYLATTMTESPKKIQIALKNIAEYKKLQEPSWGAEVLGVHLEGPFIAKSRMGAQNPEFIQEPDIALFQKFQTLSSGLIKLVTVAPEENGALELINYLVKTGVVVSLGHSDANFFQAKEAIDLGARHCTHLYNAMSSFHHRTPGLAVAVLGDDRVRAELIADGIHVDPEVLCLSLKIKGISHIILVTDAMRAQCLQEGQYDLGGQAVYVKSGAARLASGVLAGSVLSLNQAFLNIQKFSGCGLISAVKMCSENPAKQLGIFDKKGSIAVGKDADLVILDAKESVHATLCRGQEMGN